MLPNLSEIIKALSLHQVEFVIIGGMAAVAHGVPVTTFDLDICYLRTLENIKKLVSALRSFL